MGKNDLLDSLLVKLTDKLNEGKSKKTKIGVIPQELYNKLLANEDAGEALKHEFELELEQLTRKYQERERFEVHPLHKEAWDAIHDHFNHTDADRADDVRYNVNKTTLMLSRIEDKE